MQQEYQKINLFQLKLEVSIIFVYESAFFLLGKTLRGRGFDVNVSKCFQNKLYKRLILSVEFASK